MAGGRSGRAFEAVAVGEGLHAYEQWREEALAPKLFDIGIEPATFRNDFQRWWLGDLPLVAFDQTGASYARSRERARRDGVDALWVQTTETGGVDATSAGSTVRVRANMSGVCDLGRAVEQRTHPGAGRIIVLPRDAFGGAALDDLHGATASGARHAILSDHLRWLAEAPAPRAGLSEQRLASSIAAVVMACMRPGGPVPEAAAPALAGAALRRAVAYIDGRLGDAGLNVAEVASALGVSRASLYRACSDAGGVEALIWERRLQAVRAALSDPHRGGGLSEIAADHGFGNPSHFSSRFKERFGFSPRNLRPF